MKFTIELTGNQAGLILQALENESVDDAAEFGEYSYWRCYTDIAKKLAKKGFHSEAMGMNGIEPSERV